MDSTQEKEDDEVSIITISSTYYKEEGETSESEDEIDNDFKAIQYSSNESLFYGFTDDEIEHPKQPWKLQEKKQTFCQYETSMLNNIYYINQDNYCDDKNNQKKDHARAVVENLHQPFEAHNKMK